MRGRAPALGPGSDSDPASESRSPSSSVLPVGSVLKARDSDWGRRLGWARSRICGAPPPRFRVGAERPVILTRVGPFRVKFTPHPPSQSRGRILSARTATATPASLHGDSSSSPFRTPPASAAFPHDPAPAPAPVCLHVARDSNAGARQQRRGATRRVFGPRPAARTRRPIDLARSSIRRGGRAGGAPGGPSHYAMPRQRGSDEAAPRIKGRLQRRHGFWRPAPSRPKRAACESAGRGVAMSQAGGAAPGRGRLLIQSRRSPRCPGTARCGRCRFQWCSWWCRLQGGKGRHGRG